MSNESHVDPKAYLLSQGVSEADVVQVLRADSFTGAVSVLRFVDPKRPLLLMEATVLMCKAFECGHRDFHAAVRAFNEWRAKQP